MLQLNLFRFFMCIYNHRKYWNKYFRIGTIFIYHYINDGPSIKVLPIIFNNPFASCFLINLGFLLSRAAYFNKSICFPLFVFAILGFLLYVFFLGFKQYYNIAFQIDKSLWWTIEEFLIAFFIPSYSLNILFTETNSSWLIYESSGTSMLFNLVFANIYYFIKLIPLFC